MNFNNHAGLLSSMTPEQLFQELSAERSGEHVLGRVMWLNDFLLWHETRNRNKCKRCNHTVGLQRRRLQLVTGAHQSKRPICANHWHNIGTQLLHRSSNSQR
ncbi:MAG: hypothetical protein ACKPKO_40910, partial [Candidatus Fonsibacter sp.]